MYLENASGQWFIISRKGYKINIVEPFDELKFDWMFWLNFGRLRNFFLNKHNICYNKKQINLINFGL